MYMNSNVMMLIIIAYTVWALRFYGNTEIEISDEDRLKKNGLIAGLVVGGSILTTLIAALLDVIFPGKNQIISYFFQYWLAAFGFALGVVSVKVVDALLTALDIEGRLIRIFGVLALVWCTVYLISPFIPDSY